MKRVETEFSELNIEFISRLKVQFDDDIEYNGSDLTTITLK